MRYHALAGAATVATDLASQASRRLRNASLAALCRADPRHLHLAREQCTQAHNLTDRLAALGVLVHHQDVEADAQLDAFARRYAGDALVLDKWFALQASVPAVDTLTRVQALTAHPAFRWSNPNNVYALIGAFVLRNPRAFHRADGAAYRFVGEAIVRLDRITPQVAARLATAFGAWRRYEPVRRAQMQRELERIAQAVQSPDLADIIARSRAG